MIDQEHIETVIVDSLKKALEAPVIRQNQAGKTPDYPYATFTVTTYKLPNNGTWGEELNVTVNDQGDTETYKTLTKIVIQVWSVTIQSNNPANAQELAGKAHEWFGLHGDDYMKDNGITVTRVGDITNRDNLLSVGYEYRTGFDVRLAVCDKSVGLIETIEEFNISTEINRQNTEFLNLIRR